MFTGQLHTSVHESWQLLSREGGKSPKTMPETYLESFEKSTWNKRREREETHKLVLSELTAQTWRNHCTQQQQGGEVHQELEEVSLGKEGDQPPAPVLFKDKFCLAYFTFAFVPKFVCLASLRVLAKCLPTTCCLVTPVSSQRHSHPTLNVEADWSPRTLASRLV